MSFDKNIVGKIAFPRGGAVNVRRLPSTASTANGVANLLVSIQPGNAIGRLSGGTAFMTDGKWYQVNLDKTYGDRNYGYVREDVIKIEDPISSATAEKYSSELLTALQKNDVALYKNMLTIAEIIDLAEKQKKQVSDIKARFEKLNAAYAARQNEIKNSGWVKFSQWTDDGWAWLQKKWSDAVNGIGEVVSITAVLLFSAGAISAVGLYYWLRPKYSDSVVNLKQSEDLIKALKSISPDAANGVLNYLEKQIDDAYNQGRRNQRFDDAGGMVKTGLIVVGTFIGAKLLFDNFGKK